ncbi:MAG: MaoC family dehydratase N-terminal domain-containing protein [Thaumarchaeota archaeon]|nr:MaoC family dehydratase N-terminal domain-containing protein [Nitrososphaerota archaeon]MCL5068362.1 MaoC family dehydratase N-terminal domain-containing protein [Nitrososphaerota archaeon]MDG6907453.1 MaoC family dehydratase N-terminal domain-containing protein [Nitrososphaerota archaeon]
MHYEDFEIGSKQITFGRTVTETDIVMFAGLTGASNPLFLDEEYAKKTAFGHRIAPGLLTLSIATGCAYQLPSGPFGEGFIALLGMSFKAIKPVIAGDTLKVAVVVKEKLPPKDGRGRVVLEMSVENQRNETVMMVEGNFLVRVRKESQN